MTQELRDILRAEALLNIFELLEMCRGNYGVLTSAGSWIVFLMGVFGEKKLNLDACDFDCVVLKLLVESTVCSVGGFWRFPGCRSGDVDLEEDIEGGGGSSFSPTGMPRATGAEDPVNQEASPPFDLSASFIKPSRSPVRVDMNSSSIFCFTGLRSGDFEFGRGARKGSKSVSER